MPSRSRSERCVGADLTAPRRTDEVASLDAGPSVVQVVPLTWAVRSFHSEVVVEPDESNGLDAISAAQCQHIRAISPHRVISVRGNVGPTVMAQLRETIAVILDLP